MEHDEPTREPYQDEQAEQEIQELARTLESQQPQQPHKALSEQREDSALRKVLASPALVVLLLLIALALTALNLAGVPPFGFRARPLTTQETTQHLQATLRFAKEEILGFQEEKGRLPRDLSEIAMEGKADLAYEPLPGGGFRLTAREGGKTLDIIVPAAAQTAGGGGQ